MSTRSSLTSSLVVICHQGIGAADVTRDTRQHALELCQYRPDPQPAGAELKLTDCGFVNASALLDHGNGPPNRAVGFEEPEQHDAVGQITDVDRCEHRRPDHTVLRDDNEGRDAPSVQI